MRRVLVTGASRGLGLEFTRQLIARGDRVIAACRNPARADALQLLARCHGERLDLLPLDVTQPDSIISLADRAAQTFEGLDLLLNNAGRMVSGERFGMVTEDALTSSLRVNAVGPFLLTQALAPSLAKSRHAIVANISSQLGSIARTDSFRTPSYAISKAALNMATVQLARGLAESNACVVAFHPGWVKTDMGGVSAPLTPAASVAGILAVIENLRLKDSGSFVDYMGRPMSW